MKDHLIRVNSIASSSIDEPTDVIELRSRGRNQGFGSSSSGGGGGGNVQRFDESSSPTWLGNRVLIERKVQPGDTLNKLSLQYSVQISDLKRANTLLVNDQDIYALPVIKIPVSRLFADRIEAENRNQVETFRHHSTAATIPITNDDRRPLLDTDEDEDSDEHIRKAKVGALLQKTDANITQVRGNLPSPGIESGAFHFVDATSPDHTMRKKSEAEAEIRHNLHHHTSQSTI
uniref:LysM domain-containing protein n=1 Tax=Panagrolaimus sp. ES5 TaxID=591445 RepID=A0AC34FL61_9BILA